MPSRGPTPSRGKENRVSDVELAYAVGQTVEVTAIYVAQGGWCVARPEGLPVLFVRHALPGERVLARVTEVTSRFARAEAIEVRGASPDRVEAPCPNAHPGGCGGCDWQHASLPAQRALKAAVIAQQLRRVAGLELDGEITVEALTGDEDSTAEVAGAAATTEPGQAGLGWRTRVQFAVRPDGLAGLRAHRSHEVIDIGDCPIAHPAIRDLGLLDYSWEGAGTVEAAAGGPETGPEQGHRDRVVILTRAGRAPRGRRAPGSVPGRRAARDERGRDVRVRSEDRAVEVFPQDAVDAVEAESVLIRSAHRLTPLRGPQFLAEFAAGRHWEGR